MLLGNYKFLREFLRHTIFYDAILKYGVLLKDFFLLSKSYPYNIHACNYVKKKDF